MADFVRILPVRASEESVDQGLRGRRYRLLAAATQVHLFEEQVAHPVSVNEYNVRHFIRQTEIVCCKQEAVWLRDALTEMLGEIVDVEALKAEIERLRSGETAKQVEAMRAVLSGFAALVENENRKREQASRGGQHVTNTGDLAACPPGTLSRLNWWAREMRELLHSPTSDKAGG